MTSNCEVSSRESAINGAHFVHAISCAACANDRASLYKPITIFRTASCSSISRVIQCYFSRGNVFLSILLPASAFLSLLGEGRYQFISGNKLNLWWCPKNLAHVAFPNRVLATLANVREASFEGPSLCHLKRSPRPARMRWTLTLNIILCGGI